MVLSLDFSIVDSSGGIEDIRHRFYQQCNISLRSIIWRYGKYFGDTLEEDIKQLKAYEAEWKKQHPYPGNKSFLVYCFGNQGYRVFPI
jgi:hypothetical protein